MAGAESESNAQGQYHKDLRCTNKKDGSIDLGLWQINNFPWRADPPYDSCQGRTGKTVSCWVHANVKLKDLPACCKEPSAKIERDALDDEKAVQYAYAVWKKSNFNFSRWAAYNTSGFNERYPAALAYVKKNYPSCNITAGAPISGLNSISRRGSTIHPPSQTRSARCNRIVKINGTLSSAF